MMVYICTKFHENILNGISVIKRTRKVNVRTDGRTDGRYDIIRPVFDGRIKIQKNNHLHNAQHMVQSKFRMGDDNETKTYCKTVSVVIKYKKTSMYSMWYNLLITFLSTNPKTLILSSLVS